MIFRVLSGDGKPVDPTCRSPSTPSTASPIPLCRSSSRSSTIRSHMKACQKKKFGDPLRKQPASHMEALAHAFIWMAGCFTRGSPNIFFVRGDSAAGGPKGHDDGGFKGDFKGKGKDKGKPLHRRPRGWLEKCAMLICKVLVVPVVLVVLAVLAVLVVLVVLVVPVVLAVLAALVVLVALV